jgi:hypothetical protein
VPWTDGVETVINRDGSDVSIEWVKWSNSLREQALPENNRQLPSQASAQQPALGIPRVELERARRAPVARVWPTSSSTATAGLSPVTAPPVAQPGPVPRAQNATMNQGQDGNRMAMVCLPPFLCASLQAQPPAPAPIAFPSATNVHFSSIRERHRAPSRNARRILVHHLVL